MKSRILDPVLGATLRSVHMGPPAARPDNGGGFFLDRPDAQRRLLANPRPLSEPEQAVLRQAVAPLLADLATSGLSLPDIRDEAHEERAAPSTCGWIEGPGRTGEGISVRLDSSAAEQVAQLAEQIQNWAADQLHDSGHTSEWPACPRHRDAPHRLQPEVRDGVAVWTCPQTGELIWPIGQAAG